MSNYVYIVHCIDTEGPLYESLEATFERVKDTFGIELEPSYDTLQKLQRKELELSGKEDAIAKMVKPENLDYNDNWEKIDQMLDEITSDNFRNKVIDSFGGGWVYNWFCVDHVGYNGQNPRRRDLGFHNIFDHYRNYNRRNKLDSDSIQWHFHPVAIQADAHRSGTNYVSSALPFEILARKIIDRNWFPSAYRPGFHTERPDSHWFLEQWIPFDYANQSMRHGTTDQPDLQFGRFGNWSRATKEWELYHPDHDDYQIAGNCRRWIARCLNFGTRANEITMADIEDGFKRAQLGQPALLSVTNHDHRDMKSQIDWLREMIRSVAEKYPTVKFKFCSANEAMRKTIGIKKLQDIRFEVKIEQKEEIDSATVLMKAKTDIFGPQPFFAIKTRSNKYLWQNLDFVEKNVWSYTFDFNTIGLNAVEKIGIAANTAEGLSEVIVIDPHTKEQIRNVLNDE